jgi:hypothetical protein
MFRVKAPDLSIEANKLASKKDASWILKNIFHLEVGYYSEIQVRPRLRNPDIWVSEECFEAFFGKVNPYWVHWFFQAIPGNSGSYIIDTEFLKISFPSLLEKREAKVGNKLNPLMVLIQSSLED